MNNYEETEQSIKADCYDWIAECINTRSGYSVQEHVEAMKEVLEQCSDYFHDFLSTAEGGDDEAVFLAKNLRNVLEGKLEKVKSYPKD